MTAPWHHCRCLLRVLFLARSTSFLQGGCLQADPFLSGAAEARLRRVSLAKHEILSPKHEGSSKSPMFKVAGSKIVGSTKLEILSTRETPSTKGEDRKPHSA